MTRPLAYLNAMGVTCPLGTGAGNMRDALRNGQQAGMQETAAYLDRPVTVGRVTENLPELPLSDTHYQSRNNRLLWSAYLQIRDQVEAAINRFGRDRVAVILGTSTSGILEGEAAMAAYVKEGALPEVFDYATQEIGAPSLFLADVLDLSGPAYSISTACSSSGKVFSAAARLMALGLCDAALVGGVDSLCAMTVKGFDALDSVSHGICNPMSANRDGINIGEGAALYLMTQDAAEIALLGVGESSDAYHPNAPDPEGGGAIAAMKGALLQAGLSAQDIAYLNMHGTATELNDAMESLAIAEVLGADTPVSSTKPMTGHMLGAAAGVEAAMLWLCLQDSDRDGWLPPHLWDGETDAALPALNLTDGRMSPQTGDKCAMMSNSFAFGGNNVSLILGRGY